MEPGAIGKVHTFLTGRGDVKVAVVTSMRTVQIVLVVLVFSTRKTWKLSGIKRCGGFRVQVNDDVGASRAKWKCHDRGEICICAALNGGSVMWGGSGEDVAESSDARVEPVVSLMSILAKRERGKESKMESTKVQARGLRGK